MRRIGIFIGVLSALIALISLVSFSKFDVNQYRTAIQTEMEGRLGRQVVLGNLQLKLLPLRLRVQNFAIAEDPDFGRQTPFLKADTVDLSIRLLPMMLRHRLEIVRIELKRPRAEFVKNQKGVWNFSSLSGVVMKGNVTLRDSQVTVTNLQKKKENRAVYDHMDITIPDFSTDKPFSIAALARISSEGGQIITLRGKVGPLSTVAAARTPLNVTLDLQTVAIDGLRNFLSAPILAKAVGVVSGETTIKTENGKMTAVGDAKLENVRVNGLEVGYPITAKYSLEEDVASNVLTIVSSTIGLGAAPVSVTGSVNFNPATAVLDLRVVSKLAPVGEVRRLAWAFGVGAAPDTTVTGQLDSDVQIRGPLSDPALNGSVSARNLRIVGKGIPQPVQIATVDLSFTPLEIRSNNFEVRSGATTAMGHFGLTRYTSKSPAIDFSLRTSNANLPEVLAIAKAYGARGLAGVNGSGTINLEIHASGPVQSLRSTEIIRLLNGTASLNLSNVRIAGLDVEHELSTIGGFKKSVEDRGGTTIGRLTGGFAVRNGVAQTNDLRAVLAVGTVAAAGAVNLSTEALNLRATAVLSKAASREAGGSSLIGTLKPVIENGHGELVIPGRITGTLEKPKFDPDMEQFTAMKLKGMVPTSDNPFGLLGTLLGHEKHSDTKPPLQNPAQGVEKFLGNILGGKK